MLSHYVNDFDHKWIDSKAVIKQSQLGTPDLQSLADLSPSIKIIQDMRIVLFITFLLLKFNINELIVFIFKLVTGH
jgi:hypothetical protein